jgi:hypothetical protein
MPKYRKKPVVIEAIQYNGHNGPEIELWSDRQVLESPILEPTKDNPSGAYLQIHTLEGWMTCIKGAWVIRGIKGEYYSCKDDIFAMTYEPVDESVNQPDTNIRYVAPDGTVIARFDQMTPEEQERVRQNAIQKAIEAVRPIK